MAKDYGVRPSRIVFGDVNDLSLMEEQMFDMFISLIGWEAEAQAAKQR